MKTNFWSNLDKLKSYPYTNYLLCNTAHIEALLDLRRAFAYGFLLAQDRAPAIYDFQNTFLLTKLKRWRFFNIFSVLTLSKSSPPTLLNQADIFCILVLFDLIMVKFSQFATIFGALTWFEHLEPSQLYPFRPLLKITRLWLKKK